MKNIVFFICLTLIIISCENIQTLPDGRKYKAKEECIKSHTQNKSGYHWGMFFGAFIGYDGKLKYGVHSGYHFEYQCFSSCTEEICDEYYYDTIWIN